MRTAFKLTNHIELSQQLAAVICPCHIRRNHLTGSLMHVTLRWYQSASALVDAMSAKPGEVEELLRGVPGFLAYYAMRDGDNVTTVTVCQDKAGTDESTRRAGEWVKTNLKPGSVAAPRISEGDTYMGFSK